MNWFHRLWHWFFKRKCKTCAIRLSCRDFSPERYYMYSSYREHDCYLYHDEEIIIYGD